MTPDVTPPDKEPADPDGPPDPDELVRLEKDIQQAKAHAEEAVYGVSDEHVESFVDSGANPEDDDETIAPP